MIHWKSTSYSSAQAQAQAHNTTIIPIMDQIPLNHEPSAGDTHKQAVSTLPPEVVQCLENARFLHLATCVDNQPHVSLMNYTYIPSSEYSSAPVIVMTTNLSSKKTNNLLVNPNVSLLVHDWVSHRPPTQGRRLSGGSPGPEHRSSLASLLENLNTSAMSSISATINGTARLLDHESDAEAERFYRDQHLQNNTFDSEGSFVSSRRVQDGREDGGREIFVAGEEVKLIVVQIKDIRTSDWKGGVRDWVLVPQGTAPAVNGVR
ncbi:pyridoxamine 5'-phosphate oxidase [Xylariomycetidae sp. FL2044]|nr:pyridoxamine 5'-phosphate oxidase [Xylariomycetidae sp. FL2044]